MPTLNFNAPEEFQERMKSYMAEQGLDNQSLFIREALEAAMAPKTLMDTAVSPQPPQWGSPPGPAPQSLADAADIIMAALPEHQRQLILDVAQERGRRPHDFILSYCKMADERGETPSLIAEQITDEEDGRPFAPATKFQSPIGQAAICAWEPCGKAITISRRGQKYCPDPDDGTEGCGRKASLAEIHKRREEKTRGAIDQHKLAAAQGLR